MFGKQPKFRLFASLGVSQLQPNDESKSESGMVLNQEARSKEHGDVGKGKAEHKAVISIELGMSRAKKLHSALSCSRHISMS